MDKIFFDFMNDVKATRNNYKQGASPLEDLHDAFGFDFNKPIICEKKDGAYTPCALAKEFGFEYGLYEVVVLLKDQFYYKVAEITSDNVEINLYGLNWFNCFYTKQEYNDRRKNPWFGATYVIAQKKAYLHKTPTSYDADLNKRYYQKNRWTICEMDANNRRLSSSRDELDKSGYLVELKREILESKKKTLLAERNKRAYKAMTNTQDMIDRARKTIEAKKIEFSQRFCVMNDYDTLYRFRNELNYLLDCYREIEDIADRDRDKDFPSPESFNNAISYIYKKLATI